MAPFRFGLQLGAVGLADAIEAARDAEAKGFDTVLIGDHVGPEVAPLAVLSGLATATSSIRIGTLVLNNDWYHPGLLAREVATIDHLAGGRVELGLGAGHTPQEYAALGRALDPPAVRKARLAESVQVLRILLDGGKATFDGEHVRATALATLPAAQAHLPILVAGRGTMLLSHAARHADIIGLSGLGRTLPDGHRHEVRWSAERLDADIALLRSEAGDRWDRLELNAMVQAVHVTSDRRRAAEKVTARAPELTVEDALTTPFLAIGTHRQIADQLLAARERWNLSYFAVRDAAAFAPVIGLLRT